MPSTVTELWGIQHLTMLSGMSINNIRDAKTEFGPEETGIDVVFDLGGRRLGAQHTIFHADEGQVPGKRGSPARATEEAIARATDRPFGMFVNGDYRPALTLRIDEKIAIAARHDYRDRVAELWLVISAQLNRWGAAASTAIMPETAQVADLNSLYHSSLSASKFDRAYLICHIGNILYGWDRHSGWSLIADPDAQGRAEGRAIMDSLLSTISPNWQRRS